VGFVLPVVFGVQMGHRDQDTLDEQAVRKPQQQLACGVARAARADLFDRAGEAHARELRSQAAAQVGHLLGIEYSLRVDPSEDLVRAEPGLATFGEKRTPLLRQARHGVTLLAARRAGRQRRRREYVE